MPESTDAGDGKSWEIWTVIGPLGGSLSLENLPLPSLDKRRQSWALSVSSHSRWLLPDAALASKQPKPKRRRRGAGREHGPTTSRPTSATLTLTEDPVRAPLCRRIPKEASRWPDRPYRFLGQGLVSRV